MIYNRTKEDLPPWPKNFKLRIPGYDSSNIKRPVWSPDGTQIACIAYIAWDATSNYRIVIFDQRRGLLHFRHHDDNVDNSDIGWFPHDASMKIPELKFSPDGSFLVLFSRGLAKIWDYNTTGYYLQLQEWDVSQELNEDTYRTTLKIDISPCSRYVVVLLGRHVLLKDVQNNGGKI
jgi:WD40 repeat protein